MYIHLEYGDNKEQTLSGVYMNKKVDISIFKDEKPVAAIGVKFIMSNYLQNSNNYFENMLGETANLRSNGIAYFQIFVLPDSLPYFNEKLQGISKVEHVKKHYIDKYIKLSYSNPDLHMHTPNKTLFYIVEFPEFDLAKISSRQDYINYYNSMDVQVVPKEHSDYNFGNAIIYNNYEKFIDEIVKYCTKKGENM